MRVIQPIHWAGTTKHDPEIMVCGACPTPEACAEADRCARARQEDYDRDPIYRGVGTFHYRGMEEEA